MPLTFRKSIRLGKFMRLNFSKRGTSISVGPRGAKVNIGSDGKERITVSKGGFRYTKQTTLPHEVAQPQSTPPVTAPETYTPRTIGMAYFCWLALGLHYAYFGKSGLQVLFWLTLGGMGVWALVYLFRIPGMVRRFNDNLL